MTMYINQVFERYYVIIHTATVILLNFYFYYYDYYKYIYNARFNSGPQMGVINIDNT